MVIFFTLPYFFSNYYMVILISVVIRSDLTAKNPQVYSNVKKQKGIRVHLSREWSDPGMEILVGTKGWKGSEFRRVRPKQHAKF